MDRVANADDSLMDTGGVLEGNLGKCANKLCNKTFEQTLDKKLHCLSKCAIDGVLYRSHQTPNNVVVTQSNRKRHETEDALSKLSKNELLIKLHAAYNEIEVLKGEIVNIKVAFADSVYNQVASRDVKPSYASVLKESASRSVLIAKIGNTEEDISGEEIEKMLDSGKGGPLVQQVTGKGKNIVITFNDDKTRDQAKYILESKPNFASNAILSIPQQSYPVVALFVGSQNLDEVKKELEHRNPILEGQLKDIRVLSRQKGHVKIYVATKLVRDALLRKGRIYLKMDCNYTAHKVVPMDLNREVRRQAHCWPL